MILIYLFQLLSSRWYASSCRPSFSLSNYNALHIHLEDLGLVSVQATCPLDSTINIDTTRSHLHFHQNLIGKQPTWKLTLDLFTFLLLRMTQLAHVKFHILAQHDMWCHVITKWCIGGAGLYWLFFILYSLFISLF